MNLKFSGAGQTITIWPVKYLNNILEQDHCFIKRITSLILSRIRAAPSARLGHLAFEGQGAFPSQG